MRFIRCFEEQVGVIAKMPSELSIPSDAVKYILYQRTEYLRIASSRALRALDRLSPWSVYRSAVAIESRLRRRQIRRSFSGAMRSEYEQIRSHLPRDCNRILDIGCGVGGIDALLFEHYKRDPSLDFFLLDKSDMSRKVFYGFKDKGAFYNSLDVAQRLLADNGIGRKKIHPREVGADGQVEMPDDLDLVVSLISWGYHYPLSTYLQRVHGSLRAGGHLILDLRRGVEEPEQLEPLFSKVDVVVQTETKNRVVAVK